MEHKKVETPAYWNEEQFQPLMEVTTIFGNKIKIPSRFKGSWDMMMFMCEKIISAQGKAAGLKTIREIMRAEKQMTSKGREDFCKVFLEDYQEPN